MSRGPLPNPSSRRRNAPTIATTSLPAEGRTERAPTVPRAYSLGKAGKQWWRWAWALPQATKWDAGALYVVARRAALEDDLAAVEEGTGFCLDDYMSTDEDDREVVKRIEQVMRKLAALAGGRVSVMKEMRELDNRLGLNPKALADLRWSIAEPVAGADDDDDGDADVADMASWRERLG